MRKDSSQVDTFRVRIGALGSDDSYGLNGAFMIPFLGSRLPGMTAPVLRVISSSGKEWHDMGLDPPVWEHVSVSLQARCPTWEEMDFVKQLFWNDDELVLQLHVPREKHINRNNFCLHLWKPVGVEIPLPPPSCVG